MHASPPAPAQTSTLAIALVGAVSIDSFLTQVGHLDCFCLYGSTGYECRNNATKACYPKNEGLCPAGTDELGDCCGNCAPGSSGTACQVRTAPHGCDSHTTHGALTTPHALAVVQDSRNLACYAEGSTGLCPAGTLKCPVPPGPTPAPSATPCQLNWTMCNYVPKVVHQHCRALCRHAYHLARTSCVLPARRPRFALPGVLRPVHGSGRGLRRRQRLLVPVGGALRGAPRRGLLLGK